MVPPDPQAPQQIAQQRIRGMGQQVQMMGDGQDPLSHLRQMQMDQQQRRLQEMEMRELERQQEREAAQAEALTAKAELETATARAQREELVAQLEQTRQARQAGQGMGGGGMAETLVLRLLEQGQKSQEQMEEMRQGMVTQLRDELAQMRQEAREMMLNPGKARPYDVLADDLEMVKGIRDKIRQLEPDPYTRTMAGDAQATIEQMKMMQAFELQREQMSLEREKRQREWEDIKEEREAQRQIRLQEINVGRERNQALARTLDSVAPRIAEAFSGMHTGPPVAGDAPAPEGESADLLCPNPDCQAPIHVGARDTHVVCPKCGKSWDVGR